jgi:hypothetical protein
VSRRRSGRATGVNDTSREATIEALLDDLCVTFGFCLPPDAKKTLGTNPPEGVHAFTDAVIRAEGMDPETLDTTPRRSMREMVDLKAGRAIGPAGAARRAVPRAIACRRVPGSA